MNLTVLKFPDALNSAVFGLTEIINIANSAARTVGVNEQISHEIVEFDPENPPSNKNIGEVLFIPPVQNYLEAELSVGPIIQWLSALNVDVTTVSACCSGVMLIAEAGLLDKKKATTTWWLLGEMGNRFPRVRLQQNAMLVEDSGVITSSGPYSYTYQALHLVERFLGPDTARLCAKLSVVEPGRPLNGIFAIPSILTQSDPFMMRIQELVVNGLESGISVDSLANEMHVSSRTLHRRIKDSIGISPNRLISAIRIETAKTYLETTSDAIATIAGKVGFEDTSSFRSAFSRNVGTTPTEYRSRMSIYPESRLR